MHEILISKKILFSALGLLLIGYVLMSVGTEAYSILKITIAPVLIVVAFVWVGLSIFSTKPNTIKEKIES